MLFPACCNSALIAPFFCPPAAGTTLQAGAAFEDFADEDMGLAGKRGRRGSSEILPLANDQPPPLITSSIPQPTYAWLGELLRAAEMPQGVTSLTDIEKFLDDELSDEDSEAGSSAKLDI